MVGLASMMGGAGAMSGVGAGMGIGAGATAGSTILGMNPANFAAVLGMLSQAIGPKDSVGARLGSVATMMGQSKLMSDAAQLQDAKNKAFMKEIISSIGKSGMSSQGALDLLTKAHTPIDESLLSNTPAGFYGSEGPDTMKKL